MLDMATGLPPKFSEARLSPSLSYTGQDTQTTLPPPALSHPYILSYCFSREKALKQRKNKANIRRVLVLHAHCITCCSLWIWNPCRPHTALQTEYHYEQDRATLAFALSTYPIITKSSTSVALSVTAPYSKNCLRDFKVYQHFCLLNYYFA